MTVSFSDEHLYLALDVTHLDAATSAAYAGSCTSQVVQSTSGDYTLSFDLDDCGTTVAQSGGIITFSNTIHGSADALRVSIRNITKSLSEKIKKRCNQNIFSGWFNHHDLCPFA